MQNHLTPPFPAQHWPAQQGYYAGIVLADDRATAWHLILPDAPECSLGTKVWGCYGQDVPGACSRYDGHANTHAMAAAGSKLAQAIIALPGDCYLPSRGEYALLYATLPEQFSTYDWYLTSTQLSANSAWLQHFGGGYQFDSLKKSSALCRAVRRLAIQSFDTLAAAGE